MKKHFVIKGKVSKFPGRGGWHYISVPKKYKKNLKEQRRAWGMYPIKARVNNTSWTTKLMVKKGGNFFVAFNKEARKKENLVKNKVVKIDFSLI